jgi:hypothetical protein
VRGAGGVGTNQDLDALDLLARDLRERPIQHHLVVGGRVRAGVPRPQQRAQRLAGLIGVGLQRVKSVAAAWQAVTVKAKHLRPGVHDLFVTQTGSGPVEVDWVKFR